MRLDCTLGTFTHTSQNLSEGWGGGHQLLGVLAMAVYLSQMSRKLQLVGKVAFVLAVWVWTPDPDQAELSPLGLSALLAWL